MPIYEKLLPEFDEEMVTTRRVIERVPTDKGEWKPHPKSFALGHLTQLVATMPGWIARTLSEDDMNLAGGAGYSFQKTESLLEQFDKLVAQAHDAFARTSDADFEKTWSLKMGDNVIFSLPRYKAVRQHINHLCHHRGQLTVYLRLIDVPVPSIYGPTADEAWTPPK
jgi:uncharacterized damage-inducible protein DinB